MADNCSTCEKILSSFPDLDDYSDRELGSVEDVIHKSSCSVHPDFLTKALGLDSAPKKIAMLKISRFNDRQQINLVGYDPQTWASIYSWDWMLLSSPDRVLTGGKVSLVDSEWIDLNQVRGWKKRCEQVHGQRCRQSYRPGFASIRPKWLVDCKRHSLVPGTVEGSYVTLSYVWGGVQTFTTTIEKLNELRRPGAFVSRSVLTQIPSSVKHAMALTDLLGETYLWVDCLCIVQDDALTKHQDIQDMAGIYSNATFTVVLTGPNANAGIVGIDHRFGPRKCEQHPISLANHATILQTIRGRGLFDSGKNDSWSQRAWTFQEDRFSQRRIVFQNDTVRWECRCATYSEDQDETDGELAENRSDPWNLAEAYPNTATIWRQISAYSSRLLTYPEDAHLAFSSILNESTRGFKGGFISGLPAIDFDLGLLWQPTKPMKIRQSKADADLPLPSWSWLGWEGELDTWSWNRSFDFYKDEYYGPCTETVVPHIQWTFKRDGGTGQINSIHNERHTYRHAYLTGDVPPPDGWARSEYSPSAEDPDIPEPGTRPRFIFKHEAVPHLQFWHPVPIPRPSQEHSRPRLLHHISTKTFKAQLYRGELLKRQRADKEVVTSLRNESGVFAGSLRLTAHPSIEENDTECDLLDHGWDTWCFDLVEISKGYASEKSRPDEEFMIDEWAHPERTKSGPTYRFYNVMWVVWVGDIAYRRGLGRVEESVWESLDRRPLDLTLG